MDSKHFLIYLLIVEISVTVLKGDRNTEQPKSNGVNMENTRAVLYFILSTIRQYFSNDQRDLSICNIASMKMIGHDKESYQCCGVVVYQPDKQTCCLETTSTYIIHNDRPERDHICCGLYVYARRSTSAPCQHISRNDAFLSNKLSKLKTNYLQHSPTKVLICSKTFAFYVKIAKEKGYREIPFLKARITQYRRDGKHLWHVQKRHKFIMLDKYSSGRLGRKGFIMFSNYDYLDDVIFIRRDVDAVFKAPKRKRALLKRLRKLYSTC